jgi:hypothetical protein
MVEVFIDVSAATPTELAALAQVPGFEAFLQALIAGGRAEGISLTLRESTETGAGVMQNSLDGAMRVVLGAPSDVSHA